MAHELLRSLAGALVAAALKMITLGKLKLTVFVYRVLIECFDISLVINFSRLLSLLCFRFVGLNTLVKNEWEAFVRCVVCEC